MEGGWTFLADWHFLPMAKKNSRRLNPMTSQGLISWFCQRFKYASNWNAKSENRFKRSFESKLVRLVRQIYEIRIETAHSTLLIAVLSQNSPGNFIKIDSREHEAIALIRGFESELWEFDISITHSLFYKPFSRFQIPSIQIFPLFAQIFVLLANYERNREISSQRPRAG